MILSFTDRVKGVKNGYRGRCWKGMNFYIATEVSLQQKTCVLINKNVFLKTVESFNIKNIYNYTFYLRNVHAYLSRASLYELIL